MDRITITHLLGLCGILNRRAGFKEGDKLWKRVKTDNGFENVSTPRMFYIDGAYGGHALYRVPKDGRGTSDVLRSGHIPARDLYNRIQAYIEGREDAEEDLLPTAQIRGQDGIWR